MRTAPGSTYRVQLHAGFNFRQLEDILDYLHQLGITTIYASPITTAARGSRHGYDVTDPWVINPEIGTIGDLTRIAGRLRTYGMSWIQDIVPNHMSYESSNRWLYDALERGRDSEYQAFFDTDTGLSGDLTGDKMMAPFLTATLTESLADIRLQCTPKGFTIQYFNHEFPVSAGLYSWIITLAEGYPAGLATALQEWEAAIPLTAAEWTIRREKWIRELRGNPEWMRFIGQRIDLINGRLPLLEELLQNQHYILTHYHLANNRINYRRFFTVNSLICLRMEEDYVFNAYHRAILNLYQQGLIQGLRIDHIDGLADPRGYIDRLRQSFGSDLYIVAEKILGTEEVLPEDWVIAGTTGYEFMAYAGRLLTDAAGAHALKAYFSNSYSEDMPDYRELVFEKKRHFLKAHMGGEWNNLTDLLMREVREGDRERMKEALGLFMAAFPVYRVYPGDGPLPLKEQEYVRIALERARQKGAHLMEELDLLGRALGSRAFAGRLMQFTGPLAAKGIEDSSFYVYNPLISHNEVGDDPGSAPMTAAIFHQRMQERQERMPQGLNAGTTHDTKRGEDSRIRLNYLSVIPGEWQAAVETWRELNRGLVLEDAGGGRRAPSLNDEYFIYQSLLGAFPAEMFVSDSFRERFHGFLTKAIREADTNTGYDQPDEGYEQQCHVFTAGILEEGSAFLESFMPLAYKVISGSAVYSLSQLLLKLTAPGVPDLYQGSECWELSLVDPDNRRPVDYAVRKQMLRELDALANKGWPAIRDWIHVHERKGAAKMYICQKVLQHRRSLPRLYSEGAYIPVDTGAQRLTFLRRHEEHWVLVSVALPGQGAAIADTVSLAAGSGSPVRWTNLFTGKTIHRSAEGMLIADEILPLGICLYYASSVTDNQPGI